MWFTEGLVPFPFRLSSVELDADVSFEIGDVVSLRCIVLNFFLTRLGLEFLFNFDLVGEDTAMGDGVVPPLVVVTVRSLGDAGSRYFPGTLEQFNLPLRPCDGDCCTLLTLLFFFGVVGPEQSDAIDT